MGTIPFLHLDCIKTEHHLMRLLPEEVAYRYHAVPVSTDGNRIAVAMASPEDNLACAAVTSAFGRPVSLVQADPREIDQRLAELWPPTMSTTETLEPFVQSLVELLDAYLVQKDIPQRGMKSFKELIWAVKIIDPDLIVFQVQNISQLKRMLSYSTTQTQIHRLPALLFVPQIPRWPLTNILLALSDSDPEDESANNWIVQFSRCNQSAVTILPLMPPVPGWYGSFMQHNLQVLLESNDPLGEKTRSITRRFSEEGIKGVYKLGEGEPLTQLQNELITSDPDLVIIASTPRSCLRCWMTSDIVNPLLWWGNWLVLVANNIRIDKK